MGLKGGGTGETVCYRTGVGRLEEGTSVWIIHIQDVPLRFEIPKQPCFRVEIGRFGTVIIKMIATEVSKGGDCKSAAPHTLLHQSMAGDFHYGVPGSGSHHLGQQVVQTCGVGGGLRRR